MQNWVGNALLECNLEDKQLFMRLFFNVKDKRKFKSLLNDFAMVCKGSSAADVFLSYEL